MPKSQEQCQEIRMNMRNKILKESIFYFARNGFSGTKLRDLAQSMGIGLGTIYLYFESKEELFHEIHRMINRDEDIRQIKLLEKLPLPAKKKIILLTESVLQKLETDESFAGVVALNTQTMLEQHKNNASNETTYQSNLYRYTAQIIKQGQNEGSVVEGTPLKLADYYWGVVYLYALKKLFTTQYEMIINEDLQRILLK